MKIAIIEDEKLTAADLASTIVMLQPDAVIATTLFSVKQAIHFFQNDHENIDLIFSDIQLGDGTSFDIFSQVTVKAPVIFCTAYDEYALNAFKANGIDYILKPFTNSTIEAALKKFHLLKETMALPAPPLEQLLQLFANKKSEGQGAVLVHYKDKILPVAMADIAFFFLKTGVTHLTTFDKKTYVLSKTLDEFEKIAGIAFFRVNRQYLLNRKTVLNAENYSSRKLSVALSVPAEEVILVSKEKMPQFLNWLTIV